MATAPEHTSALALIVAGRDVAIPNLPTGGDCVVERAGTGTLAIEVAQETRPDVVLVNETLPDMSGVDACRALRAVPAVGRHVPIIMLISGQSTPEQRVAAIREGVWDFVVLPMDGPQLALRLQIYAQAKRSLEEARSTEGLDVDRQLHSASELARQAERLGALMARQHSSLACVVFEVDQAFPELASGTFIARMTRVSDVVGVLSSGRIGVLAPATEHSGAVQLALRVAREVRRHLDTGSSRRPGSFEGVRLVAGFDAVTNAKYAPLDPLRLIQRAAAAARNGSLEPGQLWIRRHRDEPDTTGNGNDLAESRELLDSRSTIR